ncbi:acyl-CoA dehydrogenase family protein [bacterium]|nr:acyl-CoA dehydrogenase family protein [bacterium]
MTNQVTPGGGFLVAPVPRGGIFIREKMTDEQREIVQMAREFIKEQVIPRAKEIEAKTYVEENGQRVPLTISILRQLGDLGLLGVDIPEEFDGMGMDKVTSMLIAESSAGCMSLGATVGAHNGIGTLPIVYFGNEEQKQRYLPRFATGEWISCYALTEPGSGSDALSGKATAVLNEAGTHYLLNGEKQFITNGSWADVAIVFARVENKYSAFIVDLDSKGVSRGAEEKKMGITGSSTCNLIFEDVAIPRANLLGNIGDGPTIALNMLNLGRMKLGFGALGVAKYAIDLTLAFGKERKQFGQPVITFGIQKRKLADLVIGTYATDALSFRAVGAIDQEIAQLPADGDYYTNIIKLFRAFALECAAVKIAGSENLEFVMRNAVRMHGGYGFVEEYRVESLLRDNVVDNIYEGTNDINRLTMFDTFARNVFGAKIPFREYLEEIAACFRKDRLEIAPMTGPLADEYVRAEAVKRMFAFTLNEGLIYTGKGVRTEQEFMEAAADGILAVYALDSSLAKTWEIINISGEKKAAVPKAISQVIVHDYARRIADLCSYILNGIVPEDNLPAVLDKFYTLEYFTFKPVNTIALRRFIADAVIEAGKYNL